MCEITLYLGVAMQEVYKFHIVGSNKCEDTHTARKLVTYEGERAYSYIDIDNAKWLATIIERSDFDNLPIIFDYNFDLIGGLPELKNYLQNESSPTETNRISQLIKNAINRRPT